MFQKKKRMGINSSFILLVSYQDFAVLKYLSVFHVKAVKTVLNSNSTVSWLVEYCMIIDIGYRN